MSGQVPAPAWRNVHRWWIRLMQTYASDCEIAGLDALDADDLRRQRSHAASFMHALISARGADERARIIDEACAFFAGQEAQGRLAAPAPMRDVTPPRPRLTLERPATSRLKVVP
jgi:hypothetical protein